MADAKMATDAAAVMAAPAAAAIAGGVPAGTNQAMADRIAKAEEAIPADMSFKAGTSTVAVDVNEAAIKDMMEADRKFWENDARKIEELPRNLL